MRNWLGPALRCTAAAGLLAVTSAPVLAQTPSARVTLSVTVPPQAAVEQVSGPFPRPLGDGGIEYVARVVVRSNAPYRLVARRVTDGPTLTLGTMTATTRVTASLPTDRRAVVVARGDAGVRAFEVTIAATSATMGGSESVRFYAVPEDR